ncbi:DUF4831 family protein [Candidatus Sumerlaeota bacterium]|nr:DUF4831 family protein [Candidatus Sumerlaeota bacterium]
MNLVEVKIPIKMVSKEPGKYKDFSEILIGQDPIKEKSKEYSLANPVEIDTVAVPDPDEIFGIKIKKGPLQQTEMILKLSEIGFLTEGKSKVDDMTIDLTVKTIEVAAGIAGRIPIFGEVQPFDEMSTSTIENKATEIDEKISKDKNEKVNALKPTAKEAVILAAKLETIRNRREILLNFAYQPPNMPAETLNRLLEEYEKEELKILKQFTGTKTEETWVAVFEIRPDFNVNSNDSNDQKSKSIDLLTIDEKNGIKFIHPTKNIPKYEDKSKHSEKSENSPITISLIENQSTSQNTIAQKLASTPCDQSVLTYIGGLLGCKSASGFYYRIPGWAEYTVHKRKSADSDASGNIVAKKVVRIAQFGTTRTLPKSTGSWTGNSYHLKLYENSGALEEITVGGDALTTEQVEAAGAAVDATLDIVDPVKRIERRIELIQKQNELNSLLNPAPSEEPAYSDD